MRTNRGRCASVVEKLGDGVRLRDDIENLHPTAALRVDRHVNEGPLLLVIGLTNASKSSA